MHPIDHELGELWFSCFPEGSTAPDPYALRSLRPDAKRLATVGQLDALQPWFSIQEVANDLLLNLFLSVYHDRNGLPPDPLEQVPWALVGAAAGFGVSVVLSCASGYDVPAKAQLRTYVETMLLLVAVLHDPGLSAEYRAANTDALVVDFWHKKATPKNLHKRIIQIERQLGYPDGDISTLTAWRRREYEVLSQSSHLSLLGAVMTCLSPSTQDPEINRLRLLGGPTLNSRRTLSYAATSTWHCLNLAKSKLLPDGGDASFVPLRAGVALLPSILAGWHTIQAIVPKYMTNTAADAGAA